MNVLDLVSGVLFEPAATLRGVAARGRLAFPLAVGLVALGVGGLSTLADLGEFSPGGWLAAALLGLLIGLAALFLSAAVLQLVAELLGGRGSGRSLLAVLALAQVPLALLAPAGLLGLAAGWLGTALRLAVFLWVFALQVLAVREGHGFTTGRALAVALLPLGAVFLLLVALGALLLWTGLQGYPAPGIF